VCNFPVALPGPKKLLYKLAKSSDLAKVSASPIADKVVLFEDIIAARLEADHVEIDPAKDCAVQQYTGGTTGIPKGAMLSHANVAAQVSQINYWGLELFHPPSRVIAVLPFFHIFAMTTCMNLPLAGGVQVIMLPRFELRGLLDTLTRTGANVLLAVPTLIQALAKSGDRAAPHLQALEVVVSGGAPLADEVRANWSKVSKALLAEGYGLTEASPVVCCAALRVPSKPLSIGQPIPATDIRFVDIDSGEVVPLGERGELQVKGPQVMLGYFNDPEATANAFQDGWLRTGDVGYVDEDGYVFLVDRIKDLIICSGFNVYPRVIEEALMHHPAVDETNVIGVPDEYRGEAPVAFVKLKEGKSATEGELRTFLGDKLNKIEMPREIIFKDELPKTLIGKLSKKELRAEYAARQKSNEPA
jgi:long-chain acyl-CoA synthetase